MPLSDHLLASGRRRSSMRKSSSKKRRVGRPKKKAGDLSDHLLASSRRRLSKRRSSKRKSSKRKLSMRKLSKRKSSKRRVGRPKRQAGDLSDHLLASGKKKRITAGDLLDTLGQIAKTVAPFAMLALGRKKRGNSKKAGNIFHDIASVANAVAPVASFVGLGKRRSSKKKRVGRPRKSMRGGNLPINEIINFSD